MKWECERKNGVTTPQLIIQKQVIVLGDMIHQNIGAPLYAKQGRVYMLNSEHHCELNRKQRSNLKSDRNYSVSNSFLPVENFSFDK